ncbi:MAG: AAA family ATPase [Saprospiraceae bacterium]
MILEFAVENFRSIKNRQVFSLVAEPSKIKGENVFEVTLPNGTSVRLLKTAMIYGANASGKSNLIKALSTLIYIVTRRISVAGRPIRSYDPFLFSTEIAGLPTIFEITFVFEGIKFWYKVAYTFSHIVEEELNFYPKGQPNRIFKRLGASDDLSHKVKLGKDFGNKEIEVFSNQLILNKFGTETPHELLTKLYVYFDAIEIQNAYRSDSNTENIYRTSQIFSIPEQQFLLKRLEKLIQVADTKIDGLEILQSKEPATQVIRRNGEIVRQVIESFPLGNNESTKLYGLHKVFNEGKETHLARLEFEKESEGTKALFWRGGLILEKLEQGGILVFDELDNSLHPKLVKFLLKLFSHPLSNPKNAQLIFATHEVTLLDRDMFRTDQIWFAEKNQYGETELYSAQDFDGVREDVPFDKWYLAGKFGGLPKIEDIESIFDHE